jgi:hypothetical protein
MRDRRRAYEYIVLVGRIHEGKRPRERPRRRWKDNVKIDLKEVGRRGMDLIYLTYDKGR